LKASGFHPFIAYLLLFVVFTVFSIILFSLKTTFLQYIYLLLPLYISFSYAEPGRNDFLKICFRDKTYKLIRIIENLIVAMPFVVFLLCKQLFLMAILLTVFMIISVAITTRTRFSFVIPTPFAKNPFEFTIGFRNTFYLFAFAYGLVIIALVVDNFNLGVFALILTLSVPCSFYVKPENPYYVWQYNLSPTRFLFYKMKTALIYLSVLSFPVILVLSFFYIENAVILLLCFLLGYALLMLFLLIKYAVFPDEASILEGVVIVSCFIFPPLLLVMIPYYFNRSVKQLQTLLL